MSELRYVDIINLDVVDLSHCSTQERAEWVVQHVEELAEFLERAEGKVMPEELVRVSRHALQAASLARSAANLQAAADAAQAIAAGCTATAPTGTVTMRRAASLGHCVEKLLALLRRHGEANDPGQMVMVIRLSLEAALMELTASAMRESARLARRTATEQMQAVQTAENAGSAADGLVAATDERA